MRLSLLPRKSEFFVLFEQHAQNAVEAAEALAKLFGDFTDVENKVTGNDASVCNDVATLCPGVDSGRGSSGWLSNWVRLVVSFH